MVAGWRRPSRGEDEELGTCVGGPEIGQQAVAEVADVVDKDVAAFFCRSPGAVAVSNGCCRDRDAGLNEGR